MALSAPLAVVGKSVRANAVAYTPRWPTRKIYNAARLCDEEYQHEIANHYRDFKHKQQQQQQQQQQHSKQLRRKKRRQIYVPYRRAPFYGVISGEQRLPLPTAVHYFPRFAAVYTPRGRQTLCEGAPPDESYNDTLRRIRGARTCDEFKVLVERQLRLRNGRRDGRGDSARKGVREPSSGGNSASWAKRVAGGQRKCEKCSLRKSNDNNDANVDVDADDAVALSRGVLQQSKQRVADKGRGNGQWHSVPSSGSRTRAPPNDSGQRSCSNCKRKSDNNSLAYYLQLASEYYEQRLLSSVRYLESVGERNAAQRQRRADVNAQQSVQVVTLRSTSTTAETTPASTATPTPRLSALDCFSLAQLVQLIGRKRSFRAGARGSGDWAIRVNITCAGESAAPVESAGPAARKRANSHTPAGSQSLTGRHTTPGFVDGATQATAGMHDYLNASAAAARTTAIATYASPSAYNCGGIVSIGAAAGPHGATPQTQFHELIDHLTQLEISEADASLPKIILTDCSTRSEQPGNGNCNDCHSDCGVRTQAAEVDSAVSLEIVDRHACVGNLTLHKHQQQRQRQGTFSLKQTKFNFHSSLELPDEPFYHSEARPP